MVQLLPFEKSLEKLEVGTPAYDKELASIYNKLSSYQKTLVSRHADRPHGLDYINRIFTDFQELAGDRFYGEDQALIGGLARLDGMPVVVLAQEKGHDIATRQKHNFGLAKPEGYRKAIRLMKMADQFGLPVISLVDTDGAFCGAESEERGVGEAIAQATAQCLRLSVPMISVIIGAGGSGGAIAIAAADKVFMLEHSVYSVISPEGCASILWRDPMMKEAAADAMKITAQDLKKMNIIDGIIDEPVGGAQRARFDAMDSVKTFVVKELKALMKLSSKDLQTQRRKKYDALTR